MLLKPEVFDLKDPEPIAILVAPVVLFAKAPTPNTVFDTRLAVPLPDSHGFNSIATILKTYLFTRWSYYYIIWHICL
jgi:hypothetical protein